MILCVDTVCSLSLPGCVACTRRNICFVRLRVWLVGKIARMIVDELTFEYSSHVSVFICYRFWLRKVGKSDRNILLCFRLNLTGWRQGMPQKHNNKRCTSNDYLDVIVLLTHIMIELFFSGSFAISVLLG